MITFTPLHPDFHPDMAGLLPTFFDPESDAPAHVQLNLNYAHGGGWRPQAKWKRKDVLSWIMTYPGDEPIKPIAKAHLPLTGETLLLYPNSYLCIVQKNGTSFEMGRVD
jgi:hypothetical protein